MYHTIIVAYAGGEETSAALHQAAQLARLYDAKLKLIGIIESIPGTALAEPHPQSAFLSKERGRIENALLIKAKELENRGVMVTTQVLEGNPANEIAACAKRNNADLIVIGHADKGLLARWFEGSTGAKLLRDLPCSLLIAT